MNLVCLGVLEGFSPKKIPAVSIGIIVKIHTNNVNIGQYSCCTILYVNNLMDWPKSAVRRCIEFV
jgi:hypothetical protein